MGIWTSIKHVLAAVFTKGIGFERAWEEPEKKSGQSPIEGRWIGEWQSVTNGHHGNLRCIVTRSQREKYVAFFKATYARILRVSYKVELKGRDLGDGIMLEGENDLGWLAGGKYRYSGKAGSDAFRCNYSCKYDEGYFKMHR